MVPFRALALVSLIVLSITSPMAEAASKSAKSAEAHYLQARAFSTNKQFDRALSEARQATELEPKIPTYWYYLGGQYCANGQPQEAEAAYAQAATLYKLPRFSMFNVNAQQRTEAGFTTQALQQLLALIPKEAKATTHASSSFDGAWQRGFTKVVSFEGQGYTEEERAAAIAEFEKSGQTQKTALSIQSFGNLLRAKDPFNEFVGCSYDRWFVLWARMSNRDSESGCRVEQRTILSGEISSVGQLEGILRMENTGSPAQKCPKANGTFDVKFTATRSSGTRKLNSSPSARSQHLRESGDTSPS